MIPFPRTPLTGRARRAAGAVLLGATALAVPVSARGQAPAEPALVLGPGDAIRLAIEDEPELGGEYTVSAEGGALLPLIGLVRVADRPFDEVAAEVLAAYGRELVDADVVVTPVLRIAVLGEVRQPGLLPVDPTFTLADVLAAAGGLTPLGDPGRITLLRGGESIRFALDDDTELLRQAPRPGDQILVSRRSWVRENLNVLIGAGASVLAAAVTSLILRP
jgi:polysaccharide export outer membrane protein